MNDERDIVERLRDQVEGLRERVQRLTLEVERLDAALIHEQARSRELFDLIATRHGART